MRTTKRTPRSLKYLSSVLIDWSAPERRASSVRRTTLGRSVPGSNLRRPSGILRSKALARLVALAQSNTARQPVATVHFNRGCVEKSHPPVNPVATPQRCSHISRAMKGRSSRQLVALVLGAFLALGMGVSALQAGEMAVKTAAASDTDASGKGVCADCGGADEDVDVSPCLPVCTAPAPAVLSSGATVQGAQASSAPIPESRSSTGWIFSPDPYPPKPAILI